MPVQCSSWVTLLAFSPFLAACTQVPEPSPTSQPEPPEIQEPAQDAAPVQVYDLISQDITQVPGLTSRNLSVMGVKLGDRTVDVNKNKRIGKPIKTELLTMGKIYRSSYQNQGIYVDFDKYTGKVTAIYVNTNFFPKIRGKFADVLARGNLRLLKNTFGQQPIRTRPDRNTTIWAYPDKGIQFLHTKGGNRVVNFTLKLVEPEDS